MELMITVEDYKERQARLRAAASERGFDALLVVGRSADRAGDLVYLSGHKPFMAGHTTRYTLRGRGFGGLLIPVDSDEATLIPTTPFYVEPVGVTDVEPSPDFPAGIGRVLKRRGLEGATIGLVGMDVLTVMLWTDLQRTCPHARFVEADDMVQSMRAVKSAKELALLRKGAQAADEVADLVRAQIQPGVAESDIARLIISELSKRGVEGAAATCQSGPRSEEPFMLPAWSDRKMESGDLVHMEINGTYGGYKIDICRSTVVGGVGDQQIKILETTLKMLEATVGATRPGILAESLEPIGHEIAREAGFGENYTFACGGVGTYLGHGIGLGIDEPPILAKGDKTILRPGMVLTIEPGLYRTGFGGCRIEDEVLVTETGFELLNNCARKWW